MPAAYEGTDIISYLHRKYIMRQRRISYRAGDISLKKIRFYDIINSPINKNLQVSVKMKYHQYLANSNLSSSFLVCFLADIINLNPVKRNLSSGS